MTLEQMDKDLERFTSFDQLSSRVAYWDRRFSQTKHTNEQADTFDSIVSKHSQRVLSVLRAG